MATETEVDNFFIYKVAIVCVVLLIFWFFRSTLISQPYKLYSAWVLNKVAIAMKEGLKEEKANIFQAAHQYQKEVNRDITILEIGAGTATNLAFFPQNTKFVCLEPNQYFRGYANENTKKHDNIVSSETVQGFAENMPFEDETFDVVVSTLVLCSVKDMAKCLTEIKRVLKPGGKFIFLEHVAFEDKFCWGYTSQVVMCPVHQVVFDGCYTTRDIGVYIKAAGFSDLDLKTFIHDPFPLWLKQITSGVATK